MTIATEICSVTVQGNGITTAFSYNFLIPYQADGSTPAVDVFIVNSAGVQTQLSPSAFTISGVGNSAGGTVTYPLTGSPLASGNALVIARALAYVQPFAFPNQSFLPQSVEEHADLATMEIQQLAYLLLRALLVPASETGILIPGIAARANKLFAFDASGNPDVTNSYDNLLSSAIAAVADQSPTIQAMIAAYLATKVGGAVFSGSGTPNDTVGVAGDIYIDLDEMSLYEPKPSSAGWGVGRWPLGALITTTSLPRLDIALGSWLGESGTTHAGGARYLPNAVSADPFSGNVVGMPNRHFAAWPASNAVVTDGYGTGPDAVVGASSRVVGTGTWQINVPGTAWATTTYSAYIYMRSLTGVSQTIGMGKSGALSNKTVTTAWQDFSQLAISLTAGDVLVLGGTGGCDIEIAYKRVYKTSAVPATPATDFPRGHMVLGATALATTPTLSGSLVNVTGTGQIAFIAFQNRTTFTNGLTISAVIKVTEVINDTHELISDMVSVFNLQFDPQRATSQANARVEPFYGTTNPNLGANLGYWDLSLYAGLHEITFIVMASGMMFVYIDNILLYRSTTPITVPSMGEYVIFNDCHQMNVNALTFYRGGLTQQEKRRLTTYYVNRGGLLLTRIARALFINGDSISQGYNISGTVTPYAYGTINDLNAMGQPSTSIANLAVSGSTLSQMIGYGANGAAESAKAKESGQKFIYFMADSGINDYLQGFPGYGSASAWFAALLAYCQQLKDDGFTVGIPTILPSTLAGYEAFRTTYNTLIRNAVGFQIDFVVDWAANGTIGTLAAASNPTYYENDGIHPKQVSQNIMKTIWLAAIAANS